MQTTEGILEDLEALTATALTLWREGKNASEIIQILLDAKQSLDDAMKNLRAHTTD